MVNRSKVDPDAVIKYQLDSAGGSALLNYRLYTLREAEGPFIDFEDLSAQDDVEAVRLVRPVTGAKPMELWCGKRKVKSFPVLESEAA